MKSILFNPDYHLRQDGNRVILFSDEEYSDISEEWFSFIHPYHAMMLSFFDGKNSVEDEMSQCASFFHLSVNEMERIVDCFLNKQQWFSVKSGKNTINFPRNILLIIDMGSQSRKEYYKPSDFKFLGAPDYESIRLDYPIGLNMELTMKCYANCIYCYANRNLRDKSVLTLQEIKDVIKRGTCKNLCFRLLFFAIKNLCSTFVLQSYSNVRESISKAIKLHTPFGVQRIF